MSRVTRAMLSEVVVPVLGASGRRERHFSVGNDIWKRFSVSPTPWETSTKGRPGHLKEITCLDPLSSSRSNIFEHLVNVKPIKLT